MKGHTGLDQNGTVQIIRNGQILLTGFFLPRFGCTVLHVTLVLWPGIKPELPAVEVGSFNHWTAREVPGSILKVELSDFAGGSDRGWERQEQSGKTENLKY